MPGEIQIKWRNKKITLKALEHLVVELVEDLNKFQKRYTYNLNEIRRVLKEAERKNLLESRLDPLENTIQEILKDWSESSKNGKYFSSMVPADVNNQGENYESSQISELSSLTIVNENRNFTFIDSKTIDEHVDVNEEKETNVNKTTDGAAETEVATKQTEDGKTIEMFTDNCFFMFLFTENNEKVNSACSDFLLNTNNECHSHDATKEAVFNNCNEINNKLTEKVLVVKQKHMNSSNFFSFCLYV